MVRIGQLEEIRIDGNRYVRASSLFGRQQVREQQIETVRAFLEKHVREQTHGAREPLTYEPVMALVGLSPSIPADRTIIGGILGAILERTWAEHRILLTVIVHRKTQGRTRPGPGFFAIAETLSGLEPWASNDELVERETAKVWAFYAANPLA
ncbi:hypothetical protein ACFZ8E_24840 [Methylobacterium sp. HMF5984]|uniref:hypothetical protein n=1 Tax=Methylobacterium sp. HMF5984 TaxID=3367370 RepID=UPI0038547F64